MQHYIGYGNDENMKEKWLAEIKDSPSTFLSARSINYVQFLTLGCLPDFIRLRLQEKHPNVYFPGRFDFIEINKRFNFPHDYWENKKDKHPHSIREFKGWGGILECGLFNNHMYFRWASIADILAVLYCVTLVCLVRLFYFRVRRHSLTICQRLAMWCGVLEFCYLLSFLPFTPTPDFRYHFFSIVTGFLMLGFYANSTNR